MGMRTLTVIALIASFALSACSASAGLTATAPQASATTEPAAAATPKPTASPAPTASAPTTKPTASPAAHASGVTLLAYGCGNEVNCDNLPPGTYETSGTWAFLRGLTVSLPAGWSSGEQDAGEFELHQASDINSGSEIYFWHDVVAWVDGAPRPELGTTADALADYLLSDARLNASEGPHRTFTVRSPETLIPAGTVEARSISVILSDSAATEPGGSFADCPADACVGFLTDQLHWGGGQAALTRGDSGCQPECAQAMRLYIASIGPENRPDLRAHNFVVALSTYGTDPLVALRDWETKVEPIVDNILLPYVIVDN